MTALCSVVAVTAVMLTETVQPQGAKGGATAPYAAGPGDNSAAPFTDDTSQPVQDGDSTGPDPSAADASSAPPSASPSPSPAAAGPPPAVAAGSPPQDESPSPTPAPPPRTASYEAEAAGNTLTGSRILSCSGCSGGKKVGYVGKGGTLRFNTVTAGAGGVATLVISYVNGGSTRTAQLSVNGAAPVSVSFPNTGGWSTVGGLTVRVTVKAGGNQLMFFNDTAMAPDFDRITLLT
ncbi:MAG: hypothetical protein AUI14_23810 [Actinobacteria bacterium 13_2_20CM_2_71_6]|nr:MAG: hypothetical protein AUI14_23810 [Actinobacteria bacterium 13_2_20CM_2_71_6]